MRLRTYSLVPAIAGTLALSACAFSPEAALRDLALDSLQQHLDEFGVNVEVTREQAQCVLDELEQRGVSIDKLPQIVEEAMNGSSGSVGEIGQHVTSSVEACGLTNASATPTAR